MDNFDYSEYGEEDEEEDFGFMGDKEDLDYEEFYSSSANFDKPDIFETLLSTNKINDLWNDIVTCRSLILDGKNEDERLKRATKVLFAVQKLCKRFGKDTQMCNPGWTLGRFALYILPRLTQIRSIHKLYRDTVALVKETNQKFSITSTNNVPKTQQLSSLLFFNFG